MKDRRSFLKDVCPTVAFAFFGFSFLEACDSGDEDSETLPPDNGSGTDKGYSVSGNTYTIDLSHSNFNALAEVGGWRNGKPIGIAALFLRISTTKIQAYTNVCKYHGRDNNWALENSETFKCTHQNNTFSTDCDATDALDCYESNLDGDTLTVVIR